MASSLFKTDNALKLLLSSAEAIEGGNLKRADKLLQDILVLADERPKQFEYESSVLKYFAEALARRAYGLPPASSSFSFPVIPVIHYHYNRYKINRVIKKVIDDALMGNRRLHLIDFSIPSYSYIFDGSVLRTLPNFSDDPLSVRLSYILPLVQAKHEDVSGEMKDLTEDAKEVNVKLENELKVAYANSLAEVDECKIDFRSREDEMVVVYYKFKLDKLVGDAKAMDMELVRLKKINPMIVIMLDFYSHHSDSNFLTCLEESFQYSSKTCKCSRDVNFSLRTSEYWLLNRDVSEVNNLIRRHQTLSEWQRLFSMAGFTRISLSQEEDDVIVGVDCFHFGDSSFLEIIREEEECLILGYKECPLFFLSAWKPKVEEDRHFNSISTNHQFGGGFNPNPSPLHPREPVQEDWTLNRLAALAEIYDMLTWASKVNNRKDIMSDPNQKHTFLIQSYPCYVKDDSANIFMKIYRHDMREQSFAKKAFAGKALESSHGYHFEPSIRMLDKKDYSNYTFCDIDVVLAIRLQNRYTSNDVHVVEFYWPAKKPKSLALGILNDLKHRETKFITVQVQSTEVRFQKEAIVEL